MFFSLTIFGYFKNCIFTPWEARVLGVQTYITLLIILSFPEFFKYKKGKYKIKKSKFDIRKKINFNTFNACFFFDFHPYKCVYNFTLIIQWNNQNYV